VFCVQGVPTPPYSQRDVAQLLPLAALQPALLLQQKGTLVTEGAIAKAGRQAWQLPSSQLAVPGGVQRWPQPPQLFESLCVSTQALPQAVCPVGQPQPPSAQVRLPLHMSLAQQGWDASPQVDPPLLDPPPLDVPPVEPPDVPPLVVPELLPVLELLPPVELPPTLVITPPVELPPPFELASPAELPTPVEVPALLLPTLVEEWPVLLEAPLSPPLPMNTQCELEHAKPTQQPAVVRQASPKLRQTPPPSVLPRFSSKLQPATRARDRQVMLAFLMGAPNRSLVIVPSPAASSWNRPERRIDRRLQ
jgi:hypothetical protein